jgi:hypothetical protein
VLVCGTETISFTNIYQSAITLTYDQETTGSATKTHARGYVLSMVQSSDNTNCPVTSFDLMQVDASGFNYLPWTETDKVWINTVTGDINFKINVVETISLYARAKTQYGT